MSAHFARLPDDYIVGEDAWTWLPLTPQQADRPSSFLASEDQALENGYIGNPEGYPLTLPDGVLSRVRFLRSEGKVTTEWRISARWRQKDHIPAFQQGLHRAIDFFWQSSNNFAPDRCCSEAPPRHLWQHV